MASRRLRETVWSLAILWSEEMGIQFADFVVIGGGIAGASVAYELTSHGRVILLEAEGSCGYHSTGRSAAVMSENYGPPLWSRLVSATRPFLENPPADFTPLPLLTDRGALFLALHSELEALGTQANELVRRGARIERMSAEEATRFCPVVDASKFHSAIFEPDCKDIDTDGLMTGYLRAIRRSGGEVRTNARVTAINRASASWHLETEGGHLECGVVVNAAGGWVQQVAEMAGFGYRNVVPFRRTAVTFDPPEGSDVRSWPMTFDIAETFYFKPEAGRIMVSPVDMEPTEPNDVQADELETAIAIDRIHSFTTMTVAAVNHKWAGLRTFAPDHEPVIGADAEDKEFIWLAGQGGNGVMACAAAARLAAAFAAGEDVPADIADLGIKQTDVSPARACVTGEDMATPVVGRIEELLRAGET